MARWLLNLFEFGAVLAGVTAWKRIQSTYWKWLLFYLVLVLVNELLGKYLNYIQRSDVNQLLYRYIAPFRFALLLYVLSRPLPLKFRLQTRWVFLLYLLLFAAEQFVLPEAYLHSSTLSLLVMYLLILLLSITYLFQVVQSNAILNFQTDRHFWLAVGLILFYVIFMPFHTARVSLSKYYPDVFIVYWYVQMLASCLMYVC